MTNRQFALALLALIAWPSVSALAQDEMVGVPEPSIMDPALRTNNGPVVSDQTFEPGGCCAGDCNPCNPCSPCGPCGPCMACVPPLSWQGGVVFTFLRPRFEDNPALVLEEGDAASVQTETVMDFDYDVEFAPRIWVQYETARGFGLRVQYWQFDHGPVGKSASPPAGGFGMVDHLPLGDVDLSSSIPTDVFSASTSLNAYTIDVESIASSEIGSWWMTMGGGIRFASAEQQFAAQLSNAFNVLRGTIDSRRKVEGIGPTVSCIAGRPLGPFNLFASCRGSLLYGDADSLLVAIEDLDLLTPFVTFRSTGRKDLLPMAEMQIGCEWIGPSIGSGWSPYLSVAMEGQAWHGAGSAVNENGDLGFFGTNVAVGLLR